MSTVLAALARADGRLTVRAAKPRQRVSTLPVVASTTTQIAAGDSSLPLSGGASSTTYARLGTRGASGSPAYATSSGRRALPAPSTARRAIARARRALMRLSPRSIAPFSGTTVPAIELTRFPTTLTSSWL